MRILIAEDYAPNRTALRRRLERRGHFVIEASNGAEAVALTLERRPDVILMDMSMPKMDGLEAWRTILEMMEQPPPVIALTASLIRDVELSCRELGFSAFLTKPIDFPSLIDAIEAVGSKAA